MSKLRTSSSEPQRFSRRWWLSRLRSALWVLFVTALIWIYADMQVAETKTFRVQIQLTTPPGEQLKEPTGPIAVSFKAQGTRGALEALSRQLAENADQAMVTYEVTSQTDTVVMKDILIQTALIRKAGLTVLSASPSSIGVEVDRLQRVTDVPVRLDTKGAEWKEPPKIEPPSVSIRVGQKALERIRSQLGAKPLELKTRLIDLTNAPADETIRLEAEIIPSIAAVPVKLSESTVRVTAIISQRTETKTLTVGVRVLMPPTWAEAKTWQQFTLKGKDELEFRKEIRVRGPQTDIEKLDPKDIDAYITLKERHKKFIETFEKETVQVRFPPGLNIELVGEPPVVNFKLEKVSAGETSSP